MRNISKVLIGAAGVTALVQAIHPRIPYAPDTQQVQVPTHIKTILRKDCYSCHSNEPKLAWFDQIQPGYWLVRRDIVQARGRLNFSTLGAKPAAAQRAALYEGVNMIQLGAMPLPRFVAFHHDAEVSRAELDELKAYLSPWSDALLPATANAEEHAIPSVPSQRPKVQNEWNGVPYDPAFRSWRVLSYTDRGDNDTFRMILGNSTAAQAARSGSIAPWPDGSRFAKIAWQKERAVDGTIRPGNFIQVEFMYKDAKRYQKTDGWGFGRWRGLDLKPYGQNAGFQDECTGCHAPMKGNDYVYTLPMTTAHVTGLEVVNNRAVDLPASLPFHPLEWKPLSMVLDPTAGTFSTLYGNDVAERSVQNDSRGSFTYLPGSTLALVTWKERDDPHWFGARIPDLPITIEFLTFETHGSPVYEQFAGLPMNRIRNPLQVAQRLAFLTTLRPLQVP